MSFKRTLLPQTFKSLDALTTDLVGIGIRLGGKSSQDPNIEDTLLAASIEGIGGDGRVLSLLVDWIDSHHSRINADRLIQMILSLDSEKYHRVKLFWYAIAQWLKTDHRFSRLRKCSPPLRLPFLGNRNAFLVEKNGEDERFCETCLIVPNKVLRHRPDDILTPKELAKRHLPYRFRILMGPNYRADMWANLYRTSKIKTTDLARKCYGSYPTAFSVIKDFQLIPNKSHGFP